MSSASMHTHEYLANRDQPWGSVIRTTYTPPISLLPSRTSVKPWCVTQPVLQNNYEYGKRQQFRSLRSSSPSSMIAVIQFTILSIRIHDGWQPSYFGGSIASCIAIALPSPSAAGNWKEGTMDEGCFNQITCVSCSLPTVTCARTFVVSPYYN